MKVVYFATFCTIKDWKMRTFFQWILTVFKFFPGLCLVRPGCRKIPHPPPCLSACLKHAPCPPRPRGTSLKKGGGSPRHLKVQNSMKKKWKEKCNKNATKTQSFGISLRCIVFCWRGLRKFPHPSIAQNCLIMQPFSICNMVYTLPPFSPKRHRSLNKWVSSTFSKISGKVKGKTQEITYQKQVWCKLALLRIQLPGCKHLW